MPQKDSRPERERGKQHTSHPLTVTGNHLQAELQGGGTSTSSGNKSALCTAAACLIPFMTEQLPACEQVSFPYPAVLKCKYVAQEIIIRHSLSHRDAKIGDAACTDRWRFAGVVFTTNPRQAGQPGFTLTAPLTRAKRTHTVDLASLPS